MTTNICSAAPVCQTGDNFAVCGDGSLVCYEHLCDGEQHCQDGADELNCVYFDSKPGG